MTQTHKKSFLQNLRLALCGRGKSLAEARVVCRWLAVAATVVAPPRWPPMVTTSPAPSGWSTTKARSRGPAAERRRIVKYQHEASGMAWCTANCACAVRVHMCMMSSATHTYVSTHAHVKCAAQVSAMTYSVRVCICTCMCAYICLYMYVHMCACHIVSLQEYGSAVKITNPFTQRKQSRDNNLCGARYPTVINRYDYT